MSLPRFLKSFLSLFGIDRKPPTDSESLPPVLFPKSDCSELVPAWAKDIQALPESRDCRLTRLVHCKIAAHEFILAHVRHTSGRKAIVRVERGKSDFDTPLLLTQDQVLLSADGTSTTHGGSEIHTVKFSKSEAPSVAHLAALLTMLERHFLGVGTAEQRSGWLAYCVTEVMSKIFGGSSRTNRAWVREPYGGITVLSQRDTVDALIREYKPVWDRFLPREAAEKKTHQRDKKNADADSFADMLRTMNA